MSLNRTNPARMLERVSSTDRDSLELLLRDTNIGHFAFVENGRPAVMPIAFAHSDDALILHGSTGSWWLRHLATGIPVTASVITVDGLVYARSTWSPTDFYPAASPRSAPTIAKNSPPP